MGSERLPAEHVDVSPLGQPLHFEFSKKTASNRFLKAAMTERLSTWDPQEPPKRGVPTKELINVYRRWGEGSMGLILTGNIMIDVEQLEAAGNMIIPPDAGFSGERFEAFKELAAMAKKHGSLCVGQCSHPGRQVEVGIQSNPVSASDVQLQGTVLGMQFAKPHAATQQEINDIVTGFTHAAEYMHKAGYDGIELHGAHGYLLSQFLSRTTNKRTDQYGGDLPNRSRLILEIGRSIRKKLPASTGFMLGIKLNSVEFQDGAFSPEECRDLCHSLEQEQFDFVELSGGTYQSIAFSHKRESTRKREAFFLEFADTITPALSKTRTYITGGLRTTQGMVRALDSVDGIGLARPVCQEPTLCRAILVDGNVDSALDQKLDQDDFGLTNVAAGMQMKQVARDQRPIDLSRQENVDVLLKDLQAWNEKIASDQAERKISGYADIVSQAASPYGSAAGVA